MAAAALLNIAFLAITHRPIVRFCMRKQNGMSTRALTLTNRDLEKVTEGHSNWYHSKAWVRFPIRLP